jgi:hypothetical protein
VVQKKEKKEKNSHRRMTAKLQNKDFLTNLLHFRHNPSSGNPHQRNSKKNELFRRSN